MAIIYRKTVKQMKYRFLNQMECERAKKRIIYGVVSVKSQLKAFFQARLQHTFDCCYNLCVVVACN